jgi:membrane-bound serine protease (ClpP class)
MKRLPVFLFLVVVFGIGCMLPAFGHGETLVDTIRIQGPIDPATAIYVHRAIGLAEQHDAQALVILLETPGGLMDSMDSIVQDFLASKTPIVVYIWPRGARAASAGGFITLAANIAAMSPNTRVGAAHPVGTGGEALDKVMSKKVENDAAAAARTIARERGRNVQWAEAMVRQSVSATETEAVNKHIVDLIANDMGDLLRKIDGRKVKTADGLVTIHSANAKIEEIDPSARETFLHVVDNPNIAYILMLLAVWGLILELNNPGSILPGVVGGISLIMALFSFAVLPVNLTGFLLILFAVALFLIDLHVPTHGILTAGGIISFLVGSLILFQTPETGGISVVLVVTMTIVTTLFFVFALGAGIHAQKNRIVTGSEGLIGQVVAARTDIAPKGRVFAEGSWWNAEIDGAPAKEGEMVRIIGTRKLTLIVRKET